MNLQIVIPTKDFAFEPIIRQWFEPFNNTYFDQVYLNIEKGAPPSGWDVRQKYTDLLANEDCYVTFMDDDTLIPYEVILDLFSDNYPDKSIICYGQKWFSNGIKRLNANADNMHPCRCDIGQFFFHASFLKDMNWSKEYINDGLFYEELHKRHSKHFIFRNDIDTWYNALQVGKGLYNGQIITIA